MLTETPCCSAAPVIVRTPPPDRVLVAYRCSKCGEEHEACATEQSDGTHCERLVEECPYHE